ncbi:hypothetical protein Golob_003794 [Gossypium lobatum]|uniref:Uncharacterized protein n=1 Tax=Gossypium lobatum TaxID=34289 RepID=A0A7J8MZF4_9ROSI|nr:hypothetical protein [Gossypium lobatum]
MVAASKSIKEEASKPKLKRERLRDVKRKCDELRLETQVIARQSAFNRIQLGMPRWSLL